MNLHGIFPPIATPFKDDEIDLDAMRSNVTKWMKTGLAGVLVLGSNGEAPMLDADESYRVACAAREAVPKLRAPTSSWCAPPATSRTR
jgi:4-hydroxy-2-oxoglutarate aldolase